VTNLSAAHKLNPSFSKPLLQFFTTILQSPPQTVTFTVSKPSIQPISSTVKTTTKQNHGSSHHHSSQIQSQTHPLLITAAQLRPRGLPRRASPSHHPKPSSLHLLRVLCQEEKKRSTASK
jgi:hypothetical protein